MQRGPKAPFSSAYPKRAHPIGWADSPGPRKISFSKRKISKISRNMNSRKVATVPDLASLLLPGTLRPHTAPCAPERPETPGRRALRARERAGGGGSTRRRQSSRPCRALRRAARRSPGCARGPLLRIPDPPDQSVVADAAPAARAAARWRGGIRAPGRSVRASASCAQLPLCAPHRAACC